jgi:hypothetical protein
MERGFGVTTMSKDQRTELIQIAAQMLAPGVFLSPFREDHPTRTPRRIIKAAEEQREQLRLWAVRLSAIARSLPIDARRACPPPPSSDSIRWELSEYPHPKLPQSQRDRCLPDLIWLRIIIADRVRPEEVAGWEPAKLRDAADHKP